MAEKIKLFVNGEEVEVESGKNLIDALDAVGIEIPHLCYHPALGADGNCRLCLVGIEEGRPPVVPACKTRAVEGMKVLIDTDNIKRIQRNVMELEMINHPIDCPICDQAGECKLQDYYMEYDGQKSRMTVPPVLKAKKLDFGCGVVHDQERCVLCARCVRFTRLITKTGELGIVNRTDESRVNIFPGRPLNNRYALNVVDLCPVGAMTSKDFRFQQRVWFLTKSPGICHGCSKGCNIYIDHNHEKYKDDIIYRFRPRLNEQVNGYFMCDPGRMTYKLENDNRLVDAQVGGNVVGLTEGIEAARRAISQAKKIAMVVSPNCSLEQMRIVQNLAAQSNAALSGFSDGYIQQGDGDDFLIQDDKSANRASFEILDIDSTKAGFEQAVDGADLLISFQNDLTCSLGGDSLQSLLDKAMLVYVGSYQNNLSSKAVINLPVASYSEDTGLVVNCDGILQEYKAAVHKTNPVPSFVQIGHLLGGEFLTREAVLADLGSNVAALGNVDLEHIPAAGTALTANEVSNVAA
ncbi:MAG: 2Fe-2S iron-sulfur cluster-binding protein [Desulfobulbus sp.]|jgi:NADH-quinone oxidoreductase subunit G|nr:2Fe-2S iron-sulfur cluster-binding protein [Desulfobulbus sp.]